MDRVLRPATFALIFGLAASCSGRGGDERNVHGRDVLPTVTVTEQHNGSVVPLYVGRVLQVRLRGNMTTNPPLQWNAAVTPQHLLMRGSEIITDSPGVVGSSQIWIFNFLAVEEGEGRLVFDGGAAGRQLSFEIITDNSMTID